MKKNINWQHKKFAYYSLSGTWLKLDSYSNANHFLITLLHAHFCFWGHECLSNRSISKYYLKSDAAPWVEKKNSKSVLRSWHRILLVVWKHSACMSILSLSSGVESEWKCCRSVQHFLKCLAFEYESSLSIISVRKESSWNRTQNGACITINCMRCKHDAYPNVQVHSSEDFSTKLEDDYDVHLSPWLILQQSYKKCVFT